MSSWFGTMVGMVGLRSVRTGCVASLRPARTPWAATTLTAATFRDYYNSPSYQRCNLLYFPYYSPVVMTTMTPTPPLTTTSSTVPRRKFWSWLGGDDKKWIYELRGGDGQAHGKPSTGNIVDATTESTSSTTTKHHPSFGYPISVCSIQGFRSHMEDDYFVSLDGDFAAVFDGHGGSAVSRYLRKNLYANVQAVLPVLSPVTTTTTSVVASSRHQQHKESLWTTTGSAAADFKTKTQATLVAAELHRAAATSNAPTWQDYQTALETALEKVDREVQRISHWSYQGSTAVVIWIHEEKRPTNAAPTLEVSESPPPSPTTVDSFTNSSTNNNNNHDSNRSSNQRTIIAANVGDSRAVLCRNNTAWELTRDHKPNHPMERARIEKLGGKVIWCGDVDKEGNPIPERGIYRVSGTLALSRAIGDRSERPHVTAEPEIIAIPVLDEEDEFIILATDGLWDVLESNEAVDLVQQLVQQGLARDHVASWLVEESIRRGTYDNVTVVIIWLDRSCSAA